MCVAIFKSDDVTIFSFCADILTDNSEKVVLLQPEINCNSAPNAKNTKKNLSVEFKKYLTSSIKSE